LGVWGRGSRPRRRSPATCTSCPTARTPTVPVLCEGRDTCSTKHALLAKLSRENGRRVALILGIYEMDEANTPGVGAVLKPNGLRPERLLNPAARSACSVWSFVEDGVVARFERELSADLRSVQCDAGHETLRTLSGFDGFLSLVIGSS
jgi:hypothetical protein